MKKLVLTSAFIFVAFAAFAQKSVVKQAKNETDAANLKRGYWQAIFRKKYTMPKT